MKSKILCVVVLVHLAAMGLLAQTTEFTYQGNLNNNGTAANGSYDFEFRLYDAVMGGGQVGASLTRSGVSVANGLFSVTLDFGVLPFPGATRFLEISARTTGAPSYALLAPRQKLTSSPFAIRTMAANSTDSLSANCTLCVTDAHIQAVSGSKIADGTVITSKLASGAVTEDKLSPELITTTQRQRALVGSLRWDLLKPQTDLTAGSSPYRLAFDGQNIWVTNQSSNNVTKIRASDGAVLGTFAVGTSPDGIAFDGTNIWVMNSGSSNLTRLRASDGLNLGNIASSSGNDIVFDGTHMWVASFNGGMVGKYRVSDGVNLGFFPAGNAPRALAFDGVQLWVANQNDSLVRRVRVSDGSAVGSPIPVGSFPVAIAFDGEHVWVVNSNSNNVTKIRASDGVVVSTIAVGSAPLGIAFDGTHIWVTSLSSVRKMRASDGSLVGNFEANNPRGLAFDGTNMWVTTTSNVRRMQPSFP